MRRCEAKSDLPGNLLATFRKNREMGTNAGEVVPGIWAPSRAVLPVTMQSNRPLSGCRRLRHPSHDIGDPRWCIAEILQKLLLVLI